MTDLSDEKLYHDCSWDIGTCPEEGHSLEKLCEVITKRMGRVRDAVRAESAKDIEDLRNELSAWRQVFRETLGIEGDQETPEELRGRITKLRETIQRLDTRVVVLERVEDAARSVLEAYDGILGDIDYAIEDMREELGISQ